MKALKVIAQIVGYFGIALAAFMLFIGDTGACVTLLISSVFVLWVSTRLQPKQTLEEQARLRQQRRTEDAAWHAHVQEDIRRQAAAPPPPQQQTAPPPPSWPESDWERKRRQVDERKRRAAEDGVACCPRCGSTSLSLNKKGFGGGKATAGMFVAGVPGAVAGTFGMNKMKITCLNCGYTYKPKKRTGV